MVNIVKGDYLQGAQTTTEKKSTSDSTMVIGDVCTVQSAVWATAGTSGASAKGPFRVAIRGSFYDTTGGPKIVTADSSFSALVDGFVYVRAGGTINIGDMVTPAGADAAGSVASYTPTIIPTTPLQADVQAARDEYKLVCGVYEGHADEGSTGTIPTTASLGDIIRIRFRGQL